MHFHLPKPLHGWREFAGEVGIIVLGVLIALGAEQIVVSIHDRHAASQAEADIRAELAQNAAYAVERVATGDCVRAALIDLRQRLLASDEQWAGLEDVPIRGTARTITNSLYAFPRPFSAPRRLWRSDTWSANTAALDSIDRSTYARLEELHAMVDFFDRFQDRELIDYARLMPLMVPQRLDPVARLQLLTVLGEADTENANIERLAAVFLAAARDSGIAPDRQWLDRVLPTQSRSRGACVRRGPALDIAIRAEGLGQR